jgi:P2 family phage major capsid protein
VLPVINQKGEKLAVGINRTLAGRTDTTSADREPGNVGDPPKINSYICEQTNFDSELRYAQLDAWRHDPKFQTLIRDSIIAQQSSDRIMIGWNGTSVAATTNRATYPLLQDVNKGWLHHIRTDAPAHVVQDGDLTSDATKAIYVGEGKVGTQVDFRSLDALVLDAKKLIPAHRRGDTDLVVIIGHDLLDDKYFTIAQRTGALASEVEATDRILHSSKQIGGLPAVAVPHFPANAILITTLKNLSIYYQEGTRRRMIEDQPRRNRLVNYESVNEAYVVEDYDITALYENIVMGIKPGSDTPEDPET